MPLAIVLASSSSARKKLLERLQIPFETVAPDIDETQLEQEGPLELVARLTYLKALAVAPRYPNHLVISSDQVIVTNGKAISKPENEADAVKQLQAESGQWVESLTGVGLLNTATNNYQYACIPTKVLFKKLSDEQIYRYLAKDQSYHCAGSLKVESLGIALLEKIHSDDPTALIGLPLITLTQFLANEQFDFLAT